MLAASSDFWLRSEAMAVSCSPTVRIWVNPIAVTDSNSSSIRLKPAMIGTRVEGRDMTDI